MISTNQFKNGTHIEVDGTIYRILEFQHVKPGKGGAFVRTRLRKLGDGSVIDKTFRAGEKFRPVRTETRRMQYLYDSGDMAVFMDNSDYSQLEVGGEVVGDVMRWVVPNSEVEVLFVDERPAGVERGRDVRHRDPAGGEGRYRVGGRDEARDARVRRSGGRASLRERG